MKHCLIFLYFLLLACTPDTRQESSSSAQSVPTPAKTGSHLPYLLTAGDQLYMSWITTKGTLSTFNLATYQSGKWSDPQVVRSDSNLYLNWADYPKLSVTGRTVLAGYFTTTPHGYDLQLTVWDGHQWSIPTTPYTSAAAGEHGFPSFVPLSDSTFQVAWLAGLQQTGQAAMLTGLHAAIIDRHGKITDETLLDELTCDCCRTCGAMTDKGPVIVYRDRSELEIRDLSIVRKDEDKWTAPVSIHADNWNINGCPVNGPELCTKGNHVAVAWYTAATQPAIKVAFSEDAGKNFQSPVTLADHQVIGHVDMALIDSSRAVVTWLQQTDQHAELIMQTVNGNGTSEKPVQLAADLNIITSGFPQMDILGDTAYIVWTGGSMSVPELKMIKVPVR